MLGLHFTPACVLLSVYSLHFTHSLHFTPGLQSAVLSPQSAFYTDCFQTFTQYVSPQLFFRKDTPTAAIYHDMQGVRKTKTLATSDPPFPDRWSKLPFISSSIHSWYFPPSDTDISDKNSLQQNPLPRNHPLQKLSQRMEWL